MPLTKQDKFRQMTESPVPQLVLRLAVPTIVCMMVTALYNVVDAFFVGHLSTEATAGIGISFAYMTFIQAVGFFFGHGSGNYISRQLGRRNYGDATRMAAMGFFSPIVIGLLAAILGLVYLHPLALFLGAPPSVESYACDYLRFIVLASPFMMSALTLNNQLRLQGNASMALWGIVSGAVLNMVLDPILIFSCHLGLTGASIATAVSQFVSWCLLLWAALRPSSVSPVSHLFVVLRRRLTQRRAPSLCSWSDLHTLWVYQLEIVRGGLPSLCRQTFNCLSAVLLNYAAARYALPGTEASAVAAFAVVSRAMMFAFAVVLGFCQGFQPVCGFNYGARLYGRVRQAFLFTTSVSTCFLVLISAIGLLFAPHIVALFRHEDPLLIDIGSRVMRWQCAAFPLVGLSTATNMLFQNLRMTFQSTLLSSGRQGLFFVPAVLILPLFWGLAGVEMSQAVADMLTFILSLPYAFWISRKLKNGSM